MQDFPVITVVPLVTLWSKESLKDKTKGVQNLYQIFCPFTKFIDQRKLSQDPPLRMDIISL